VGDSVHRINRLYSGCDNQKMEDEMSELKPCPFCGTSVVGIEYDGLYRWVECGNMDCNAAGKVFAFLTDVGNADHIVANNWNTRPIEDGLRAELARRDEIIARLKEVGGWMYIAHDEKYIRECEDWRALMKELEND